MKVKQIVSLNPISWLIKWELGKLKPLNKVIELPQIKYEQEYWIKHPEQTLVDKTANCINQSLLIYYNFYYLFGAKGRECGIFYFKQPSGMHAECGYLEEDKNAVVFIGIKGKTRTISKEGSKYTFITVDSIEEVLI